MNKTYQPVLLVVGAAVAVMAYYGWQKAGASEERVPWRGDLAAAQKEASDGKKKLLLYFTARWCRPCQQMKTTTWNDAAVEHVLQDYVPVKIDVGENRPLAAQYNVTGMPTFIVFDASGASVKARVGQMYADEFVRWIKQ